ncbi:hypothetical protein [Microbispora rosea]|uniref:hypothetical protein n=1 Tax=Microbispora rosea TaxID=58117 RepID=UPI0004C3C29B|nr:hypothetical protein [Microbispora rosea]
MSEPRERGACPDCGDTDVPLTKAGLLYKHPGPDGKTCPGSGQVPAPQRDEPDAVTEDEPDAVTEPDEDDWLTDDDEPAEPPAPASSPSTGAGDFVWQITVRQPALYLDDADWHQQNGLAAAKAARAAGHTPTAEARCTGTAASEDGAGLVLTYTIPTEGAQRG